jgi:SAM-dependent methyltransferase
MVKTQVHHYTLDMSNVCLICGTNAHAKVLYESNVQEDHLNVQVFSARRMPDRLHGRILRCEKCGLVYASPLVDPVTLSHLYEKSVYTYQGEEEHIERTYARYLEKAMGYLDETDKPWSYLDIGCGNGFMLRAAKKLGINAVFGVEPSSHAIAQAPEEYRDHIMQGMFSEELLQGKKFSLISCFQTLDHITEPEKFVKLCLTALKPGGIVLFINHNISSVTARILGERCPMIDIEHTYLHTPDTMRMLFERVGFVGIHTFAVRNDYPLHYWVHLFPMPNSWKKSIVSWLRRHAIGRIIIPMYPGNLGLIARKPL